MTALRRRDLAPGEWAVLGLLGEGPKHGFAIARVLAGGGDIGEIWSLPRPLVYRALGVLKERGLARPLTTEAGQGPVRTVLTVTPAGLEALEEWLSEPVAHVRDARSLLLLKLVYAERSGRDTGPLLERQREMLLPLVAAHHARIAGSSGWERTIELWRAECTGTALAFTEKLLELRARSAVA
jgi:DNA-binding PadR family transcriptional regulator